jgi:hypothetical protein
MRPAAFRFTMLSANLLRPPNNRDSSASSDLADLYRFSGTLTQIVFAHYVACTRHDVAIRQAFAVVSEASFLFQFSVTLSSEGGFE